AMVKEDSRTAVKSPKRFCRFSSRISAMALLPEMTGDEKRQRTGQDDDEGVRVQLDGEGLHEHEDAQADHNRGCIFPGAAAKEAPLAIAVSVYKTAHLRTAPNVMPRSRCLRNKTVNTNIGMTNSVVAA